MTQPTLDQLAERPDLTQIARKAAARFVREHPSVVGACDLEDELMIDIGLALAEARDHADEAQRKQLEQLQADQRLDDARGNIWQAEAEKLRGQLAQVTKERDEARLAHQCSEGVLAMTVHRLGGRVEHGPTGRHNFLQRVDALREIERAFKAAQKNGATK